MAGVGKLPSITQVGWPIWSAWMVNNTAIQKVFLPGENVLAPSLHYLAATAKVNGIHNKHWNVLKSCLKDRII